jgi:hypothetical protein
VFKSFSCNFLVARARTVLYQNSITEFIIDACIEIHLPVGVSFDNLTYYSSRKYDITKIIYVLTAIKEANGAIAVFVEPNLSYNTFGQLTLWANLILQNIFISKIVTYDGIETDIANKYMKSYEILKLNHMSITQNEKLDKKDLLLTYIATSLHRDDCFN